MPGARAAALRTRNPSSDHPDDGDVRIARSRRELALGKLFSIEYNPNYSPTSCVCMPFIWIRNRMPMALASALRHGVYCPLVKERG